MSDANVVIPAGRARRILIVEDDAVLAQSLTDLIVELGFECVGPVTDVPTALQLAAAEELDAAILNLVMQGAIAYGVATTFDSRSIPFAFASCDPPGELEPGWADRPLIARPYSTDDVRRILQSLMTPHPDPSQDWIGRETSTPVPISPEP